MITKEMVAQTLECWINAGIILPRWSSNKLGKMQDEFFNRFRNMDEDTLKYVTEKLSLCTVWPTFGVIERVAQEYKEVQNKYIYIDYYRELELKAYNKEESFDEFVVRIAEKYFPGRGEEWRRRHAFTLNFYGVQMQACKNCDGKCPRKGHQFYLRMQKGTSDLVPWASLDICPKYMQAEKEKGETYKQQRFQEECVLTEDDFFAPNEEPEPEQFNGFSKYSKSKKVESYDVQNLFA